MSAHAKAASLRRAAPATPPRSAAAPQRYDVILTGRTLPYFSKAEVSAQLSRVLKIEPPLAARLLLGRRVTLRAKADQDLAFRYARTLQSIGAECRIQLSAAAPSAVAPARRAAPGTTSATAKLPAPGAAPTAKAAPRSTVPAPSVQAPTTSAQSRPVDLRVALSPTKPLRLPVLGLGFSALLVTVLPLLYVAMIVATGATLQWHGLAHLHWLDSTLPAAFPVSYAGLLLVCLGVFALLLKPLVAPCVQTLQPPQHALQHAPGLIVAATKLGALTRAVERRADAAAMRGQVTFTVHSGALFQRLPPATWPLAGQPDTCAYAALSAAVAHCAHAGPTSVGLRLALYVERIQLWLWQHAYIADGWDVQIAAKLAASSELKACGWLMLQGCLQAGRLPLLVLARLALLAGPRVLRVNAVQLST